MHIRFNECIDLVTNNLFILEKETNNQNNNTSTIKKSLLTSIKQ